MMALAENLRRALDRLLAVDGAGLLDDVQRLWARVRRFVEMNLVAPGVDSDALELACYAVLLPMRSGRQFPVGRLGQVPLRERCEEAAELLIGLAGVPIDEGLLDRTSRLLHEIPQRTPMLDEARLLADAINLDDFGVSGLFLQAVQLGRLGGGLSLVGEGIEKRRQYGYWEARLKDGFHFEPVRQMARKRLAAAIRAADLLSQELREDQTP